VTTKPPVAEEPLPTQIVMGGITLNPGDCIGPYRYERPIGRGGMSHVILGRDPGGAAVALKVLKANRFRTGLARFRREFRALARLKHPNVIRVEAYGDIHGHPYIAMEYVQGTDLYQEIRGLSRSNLAKRWARVEEVLIDLSRALTYIHQRGLVHRDLKPSNVLINTQGCCKLTDFGIVKELDPDSDVLHSTTLVGTWAYASPEQISGGALDHRSDLYSLGVILYTMRTGRRPFVAKDMAGYLEMHRDHDPISPTKLVPGTPARLDQICMRLLGKAPRDRFQSASEILYRLEQIDPGASNRADTLNEAWEPGLVGRDLALDSVRDSISALTRREGGVVLIEGAEGNGKTRMMNAAIHHARLMGIPVHRTRLVSRAGSFEAMVDIAQQVGQAMDEEVTPEFAQALKGFAEGQGRVSGDARYQLYDSIRDALTTLLDRGPRIILVDDFHHAPAPLVDLFAYLVRSIVTRDGRALLVIAAVNTDPKAPDIADFVDGSALTLHPTRIAVGPLTETDVQQMVSELLGEGPPASKLARLLHAETEGNPFFVAEFLRGLIRQGVIEPKESGGHRLTVKLSDLNAGSLSIPPGVRQMVRTRLTPLNPMNREVIDALSVAGRETDLDVLLDVVSLDEERALDAVDALVDEGMLREHQAGEQTMVDFVHRKVGEVAYLELEEIWRSTLHRRIAVALEMRHPGSPVIAEAIGGHYLRAGENGKAFRYLATSAIRLWERSLSQQAWDISERAMLLSESARHDLTETEHAKARLKLLRVRADVAYNRGAWVHAEQVLASLHTVAEGLGDAKVASDARLCRGVALRRLGRSEAGEEMIRWVVDDARERGDRRAMIEGLRHLAVLAWEQGNLDQTEKLASEGLASASGSSELDENRAGILVALTAVQAERGQLAAATSGLAEAEAIFRQLRNKRSNCVALCNLAELLLWQGEIAEAYKKGTEAMELARDVQYRIGETAALRVRAMALLDAGDTTQAGTDLEQALVISEEQGLSEEVVATRFLCGRLALRLNDAASSVDHLRVALAATADGDPESYERLLQAMLARALVVDGKLDEATDILQSMTGTLDHIAVPRLTQILGVMALAWRAVGNDEATLRLARESARIAGTRGFRLWSLTARMILTDVGQGDEAAQAHAEAKLLAQDLCRALPENLASTFRTRSGIGALLAET